MLNKTYFTAMIFSLSCFRFTFINTKCMNKKKTCIIRCLILTNRSLE